MADAIRKLIEAVERGEFLLDAMPHPHEPMAYSAFSGSLDVAKALHDALVPGWGYLISAHDAEIWREGKYPNTIAAQVKDSPARAWLLAILRAMEAEGKP